VKTLFIMSRGTIALTLVCTAQSSTPNYFPVSSVSDYPHPEKALAALVRRDGWAKINHFCVVGIRFPDHSYEARVYWTENNTITLWDHGIEGDNGNTDTLLQSIRTWNLKRDVIPAAKDLYGGPMQTQKEEVDETLDGCKRVGQLFVIRKQPVRRNHR